MSFSCIKNTKDMIFNKHGETLNYKIVQEEVNKLFARCYTLLHFVLLQFIQAEG